MTEPKTSQPPFTMAYNHEIFLSIQQLIDNYPFQKQSLLELLLRIKVHEESEQVKISGQIERILNLLLMTILKVKIAKEDSREMKACGLPEEKISFLKEILQIVFKSQENKAIKKVCIINFIQNIIQCLGVNDLTKVLSLISQQICHFSSSLEQSEQTKLLRIINVLLKRISKTQDYHIRGQLHLTLARFLPLCHDSGFHYRAIPAKASEWQRINLNEQQMKDDLESDITYEFYEQFWEMQKYFVDIGQLTNEPIAINLNPSKNEGSEYVITGKLKKIEFTLKTLENYFNTHPVKETSEVYSQPLKFLKNFKLLSLQLSDPSFRKIIIIQIILFTFSLGNLTGKTALQISQIDKKHIAEIQNFSKNYLLVKCGAEGRKLYDEIQKILSTELYWIDLKDGWKDKKKILIRKPQAMLEEEGKHKIIDIEKKRTQIRKQMIDKMKIEGNHLIKFLQNKAPISLQETPSCTSFSYFYSQALSCLNSFDKQIGKQTEFQSRSQYNMFEWKAMRSLFRQNIRQVWNINSEKTPQKMKDYRLISLMHKKEEDHINLNQDPQKKFKEQ